MEGILDSGGEGGGGGGWEGPAEEWPCDERGDVDEKEAEAEDQQDGIRGLRTQSRQSVSQ